MSVLAGDNVKVLDSKVSAAGLARRVVFEAVTTECQASGLR